MVDTIPDQYIDKLTKDKILKTKENSIQRIIGSKINHKATFELTTPALLQMVETKKK